MKRPKRCMDKNWRWQKKCWGRSIWYADEHEKSGIGVEQARQIRWGRRDASASHGDEESTQVDFRRWLVRGWVDDYKQDYAELEACGREAFGNTVAGRFPIRDGPLALESKERDSWVLYTWSYEAHSALSRTFFIKFGFLLVNCCAFAFAA